MANVAGLFAEQERRLISAHTSAALRAENAQGHRLGRQVTTALGTRKRIREFRLRASPHPRAGLGPDRTFSGYATASSSTSSPPSPWAGLKTYLTGPTAACTLPPPLQPEGDPPPSISPQGRWGPGHADRVRAIWQDSGEAWAVARQWRRRRLVLVAAPPGSAATVGAAAQCSARFAGTGGINSEGGSASSDARRTMWSKAGFFSPRSIPPM